MARRLLYATMPTRVPKRVPIQPGITSWHCPLDSLRSWLKTAHEYLEKHPTPCKTASHCHGSVDSCLAYRLLHNIDQPRA